MEAPMRRDFEALDRSEAAEAAMAEAKEWDRVVAEAVEGREKYRGVRKVPSGKYAAEIRDPETGRQVWLGTYAAAFLAACAYDIAARSLQGRRAKPNFAYPPPPLLVSAVAATPRRRGHAYPAPQAPAPFVGHFSSQAPAVSEPAAYQSPHVPEPEDTKIAAIRLIPLRSFSFEATAVDSGRFNDPVNLIAPPMNMEAPASLAKTCFSSTMDHELKDSAASSSSRPRSLMLKKPKVSVVPTTTTTTTPTTTTADSELTGDNFTGVPVPPSAPMPIDLNAAP